MRGLKAMKGGLLYAAIAAVAVSFVLLASGTFDSPSAPQPQLVVQTTPISDTVSAVSEHVIDLPEDGGKWYTVLVYATNPPVDTLSMWLKSQFTHVPRLVSLRAQTKVFEYTPDDPLYRTRYMKQMGGVMPQLYVQTDTGGVIYKVSGSNIPNSGEQIADEIAEQIKAYMETGQCPWPRPPKPQPTPPPRPPQPPQPPNIPDIRPPEEPELEEESPLPIALGVLIVAAAAAAGVYVEWKNSD